MISHPHDRRFEIRLLGQPEVLIDGEPVSLTRRAWSLLICLILRPDDRPAWRGLVRSLSKSKLELREALGDWVEPAYGVYRLSGRPRLDLRNIPNNDVTAFDYCVERGDLLRDFASAGVDWVAAERERYHQLLAGITARLCAACSPAEAEGILDRAAGILPGFMVAQVRHSLAPRLTVGERDCDDVEATLRAIETQMGDLESAGMIAASLRRVVEDLERRATSLQPARKELLDRTSVLIHVYRQQLAADAEILARSLANSRMYAGDISGAFAELRPWVAEPTASASVLCIAGLLNLRMGWHDAAHDVFTAAVERNGSPGFDVILREKRDVQLAQSRGLAASDVARALRLRPAFDDLTPGARASLFCNQAKTARPVEAFRLYKEAWKIDLEAENPHYELNLARAAHKIGKPDVASQHLGNFEELLQTKKAIQLSYARMTMRAERIVQSASPDAPEFRIRLEEADALYRAAAIGWQRIGDIAGACSALLSRARIAEQLGKPAELRILARTVELLARARGSRFEGESRALSTRAARQLTPPNLNRLDALVAENAARIEAELPSPLVATTTI
jgi:hypothetical protein